MKNKQLLNKILNLLHESKSYVSRSVNYAQIVSNWLIGRYIVEGEQKGDKSAEYGKQIIKFLSDKLNEEFGSAYNQTNLKLYRSFYLLYPNTSKNRHALRDELEKAYSLSKDFNRVYSLNHEIDIFDLKTRELNHKDFGQMDMYVRYYEDRIKAKDDKPTLGIIMATEKDDTFVKYSILNDSNQLFATKYKVYLPSEEELKREIEQSKLNYKLNKNNYE
jgi:hypothetical protein